MGEKLSCRETELSSTKAKLRKCQQQLSLQQCLSKKEAQNLHENEGLILKVKILSEQVENFEFQ